MAKLRIGVVGLGMGRHHARMFQSHPQAKLVALADPEEARRKEVGSELGVKRLYPSLEAMLAEEQLDVVSIATPNRFHKPQTIAALEAGAHVLCEKPLAMNSTESAELVALAKGRKQAAGVNYNIRY
ncbi:MAG: Gfo/Idh/MocA family oxidoreductase, partial [Fimbriimonadales bacterium]